MSQVTRQLVVDMVQPAGPSKAPAEAGGDRVKLSLAAGDKGGCQVM